MTPQHPTPSTSHKSVSIAITGIGCIVIFSALIVNPWFGLLHRGDPTNFRDVLQSYFFWAVGGGIVIVGFGHLFDKSRSSIFQNSTILLLTCFLILLADRLLLAQFGLPLWIADADNHYRHRPNIIRQWGEDHGNDLIRINAYGHHDDDFPLVKGDRGLFIGDSITMGHGVKHEDAFPNQLEHRLEDEIDTYESYQMINAGVHGYSTFQEYNTLLRSLVFDPDFIVLGFCLNDITEPFIVNKEYGGIGVDYHGIAQISSISLSYLSNETGYGRLVQKAMDRNKSIEIEQKAEIYNVRDMASFPVDAPKYKRNWEMVFSYLTKIYEISEKEKTLVVLLMFPHTFQLFDDKFDIPQTALAKHAEENGVKVIDFRLIFKKLISNDLNTSRLSEHEGGSSERRELYEKSIRRYFLDQDHLTIEGHEVVASTFLTYLSSQYDF